MSLNIVQCTGQLPAIIIWPKMSIVPRWRNPWVRDTDMVLWSSEVHMKAPQQLEGLGTGPDFASDLLCVLRQARPPQASVSSSVR